MIRGGGWQFAWNVRCVLIAFAVCKRAEPRGRNSDLSGFGIANPEELRELRNPEELSAEPRRRM